MTEDVYPRPVRYNIFHMGVRVGISNRVTFLCLILSHKDLVSVLHFIALPKKGGPELELTPRYLRNSKAFSFGNNPLSTPTLCAKTFAGQYANKTCGAIENGGLFVIGND